MNIDPLRDAIAALRAVMDRYPAHTRIQPAAQIERQAA
jgi:hypothetical protein